MTRDVVALILDERERAIELLRQIEEDGLVIYEAEGDAPMRDNGKVLSGTELTFLTGVRTMTTAGDDTAMSSRWCSPRPAATGTRCRSSVIRRSSPTRPGR